MASFEVRWKTSAKKELRRIDSVFLSSIADTVASLSKNPLPSGVRKLQGSKNTYRIRIGDYRIVYNLWSEDRIVEIIRVRHRAHAYR